MKALDLFSGLGGWSDGLALEGFEVLGVEIEPHIAELYKHPVIVSDVKDLNPEDFKGYDLIVGSPPCREFCIMAKTLGHKWKIPPDPEGRGMDLVKVFLNFVEIAKPSYWLMENVPGLKEYMPRPRVETNLGIGMRRCFWGNFPAFLVPRDYRHSFGFGKRDPLRAWKRAVIPLPVARALGRAVLNDKKGI